jgi:hypothetical protein
MACKKSISIMDKNNLQGQILIPFTHSICLLPDDSAGITIELWWTNQEFSCHHYSTMVIHTHISPLG